MKKTLLFLKTNWRSILLLGWMIWITAVVLDVRDIAESAASTVNGIESDVSSIDYDVSSIESDVHTIEEEVTRKYGGTLRATVERIEAR